MAAIQCILFVLLVCGISFSNAEMDSDYGSGNATCEDFECNGGTCDDSDGDPVCNCPIGKAIYDDEHLCEDCAVGYFGMNCKNSCDCGGEGHFESCNAVNGQCICTSCWEPPNCNTSTGESEGYSCVLDYLESVEKGLDPYGGHVPRADDSSLHKLATELVDDTTIVQTDSAAMTVVDREEVDARPLMRFSFTLKEGPGNTDYDNAVGSIKDKVKTGEIRGTLIIDESDEDSGKVTLNA